MLLKASFDPTKEWVIPTGEVPFTPNDAPEGTEHTVLAQETKNYTTLLKVVTTKLNNHKKKTCLYKYVRHYTKAEAKLLIAAKDKRLHQVYKGLSKDVVKEAFGWDDNFMIPAPEEYPQHAWECFWNLKLDKLC